MVKSCFQLWGLGQCAEVESSNRSAEFDETFDGRGRKDSEGISSTSLHLSSSKDVSVRIVHAGRKEDLYPNAVPAFKLMEKYPGMSIARPEVFKRPNESVIRPGEILLPGEKYYVIPSTTIEKLKKRKCRKEKVKVKVKETEDQSRGEILDLNITWDEGTENTDDSFCSAEDFYVPKERPRPKPRRLCAVKGGMRKKGFVPPLPNARVCRSFGWEPSLASIEEISP